MTMELKFDLSAFKAFAKAAPIEFAAAAKDAQDRTAAKMRKGFIQQIDTKHFEALEESTKYRSKYKPMQMMKGMVRYRTKKSKGKLVSDIGVFAGKVGNNKLNNGVFKSKYGVTVARFAKVMTYGGKLRIATTGSGYSSGRARMAKQGFYVSKKTKSIKFPKRDWWSGNKWRRSYKILPYYEKHLDLKVGKAMKSLTAKMNKKHGMYK